MGSLIDLTGQKFGKLTVLYRDKEKEKTVANKNAYWKCQCECGNQISVRSADLRKGNTKSCGCGKNTPGGNILNLAGQNIKGIKIISRNIAAQYKDGKNTEKTYWNCQCFCGKEFIARGSELINGHTTSCGCVKKQKAAERCKQLKKDLTNQVFGMLTVLKESNTRHNTNIEWLCQCECGNQIIVPGIYLTSQQKTHCGCLNHKKSSGEIKIKEILDQMNIQYEEQKIFTDCRDKRPLPFDFYLSDYNILIEYDGQQHFKAIDHFGGQEEYEKRKKHDSLKTQYCVDKQIHLIRIPYTDLNILDIKYLNNRIKEILNEFNGNRC